MNPGRTSGFADEPGVDAWTREWDAEDAAEVAGEPDPVGDPELEGLLADQAQPVAATRFRASMRARFLDPPVGADAHDGEAAELASRRADATRTDDVTHSLEQLVGKLPISEPARADFRDGLRERFVAGEPAAVTEPERVREITPLRRIVVLTLAVAAAALVALWPRSSERWRVRPLAADAKITVAGTPLGAGSEERIAAAVLLGGDVETASGLLDLELDAGLRLRVQPSARIHLSPLPPLGTNDPFVITVASGEVLLDTTPAYPGNPILIETGQAQVRVTGTALGVLVDERGTCTCVYRGEVLVEDRRGVEPVAPPETVTAERTYLLFRDPAMMPKRLEFDPPEIPEHRVHTLQLEEFAR